MEEQIIGLLKAKGCKITPQRRAIIQALYNAEKFPTALELLTSVKATHPEVGLDTVYRNLNLLVALGAVNQIGLPGKDTKVFELARGQHHHHLVCLGCGATNCLNYCPVNENDLQKSAGPEFQIMGHSLELYGYCRKCRR
jgi:Fe2+ or Zn2+ uptake regulation protein